jgi:hypothetical protein
MGNSAIELIVRCLLQLMARYSKAIESSDKAVTLVHPTLRRASRCCLQNSYPRWGDAQTQPPVEQMVMLQDDLGAALPGWTPSSSGCLSWQAIRLSLIGPETPLDPVRSIVLCPRPGNGESSAASHRPLVERKLSKSLSVADTVQATSDCCARCCSYSTGGQLPIELWSLVRLYQLSQVNIATRGCARVAKCSPSMTSRLNPEE